MVKTRIWELFYFNSDTINIICGLFVKKQVKIILAVKLLSFSLRTICRCAVGTVAVVQCSK